MMLPASLSGRQLELFCEKQPRWMNITFGKLKAQNPAYKSSPFFFGRTTFLSFTYKLVDENINLLEV